MNTQPIRFFHHGAMVEVQGAHPTRSVLDWLREDAHCSGTKEGCNEGDCGACTVVIGELPAAGAGSHADGSEGLRLATVNACIQFLPTLHGKALFTVEDLKMQAADHAKTTGCSGAAEAGTHALHPVQQAMVDCHGSQCGFCTPGFVMSLWSTYQQHQGAGTRPTRQQLADDLSGNLCRCTGYRPILDAGQRMFELPAVALDEAPAVVALQALRRSEAELSGFSYSAPNPQQVELNGTPADARAGSPAGAPRTDHFHAPRTLAALAALREALPKAQLLAGSTDVGLWVNKQFRDLGDLIYVGDVAEMKRIAVQGGDLSIGAGASLEDAWRTLAQHLPALTDVWLRFASPPIRHAGTMGGNVANGSPIGDAPPVLMALDASVELRRGERVRRLTLPEFYVDYMKNRLEPGEFVQAIAVPLAALAAAPNRHVRAYKVSKRFDCDISALCAGFALTLDADAEGAAGNSGTVRDLRLAFGGMAGVVKRAAGAEAALLGQPWTQASIQAAQAALAEDFKPLSDMRASAAYRMQVAQNLLQRFWLETRATNPLASADTSVWSVMPHDAVPALAAAPASTAVLGH